MYRFRPSLLLLAFVLCGLSASVRADDGTAAALLDFTKTLRVDYTFAGDTASQHIFLSRLHQLEGWAGRRHHLDSLLLRGNGQITLRALPDGADSAGGEGTVLYRTSFSTLFQEWLTTVEAVSVPRSFENVFLLPMPRVPATLTVELFDNRGRVMTSCVHEVRPSDILIAKTPARLPETRMLHRGGTSDEAIDVAIVAEGYTRPEMGDFYQHAAVAVEQILAHEPFASLRDRFNFVAVAAESDESGVSVPREGNWRRTAVGSHFDTFYSERYLTTLSLCRLHDLLAGLPYEHIIILANTDTYGGGGIYNSYTLTTARHKAFRPVVVHEFGHSFAGLGDEYYYDDQYTPMYYADVEPWEQNLTTLTRFGDKWEDLLPAGTPRPTPPTSDNAKIGVYEGGGYQSKGVFRAYNDCRMKTNECPAFCPVCQRAIRRLVDFYTR